MPLREDERAEVMEMINQALAGVKAELKKKPEPAKPVEPKYKKKEVTKNG